MKIIKNIGIIFSVICSLLILLYFSTYISRDSIKSNVVKSANILHKQGPDFIKKSLGTYVFLHNHTDALMINITYGIDPNNKLESILINKRNYNPNVKAPIDKEALGNLKGSTKNYDLTIDLLKTVNNKKIRASEYMKYWHGYIIILKPLLLFLDITGIRILITILLLISLSLLCFLIYKEKDWMTSLAVFLSIISANLVTTALFNIQGMFVFLIAIISSIIVMKKDLTDNDFYILIIINGILTAFFDFLTTPIITLLIPVIIRNLKDKEKRDKKQIVIYFTKCFIIFFVSYIGFWFLKWLIVDLIYHRNMIRIGIEEIFFRTGVKYRKPSILSAFVNNILNSINIITISILILYLINIKKIRYKENIIYNLSILAIILWYIVTSQHATQHPFFTYRNMVVITLAIALTTVSKNKKKKR